MPLPPPSSFYSSVSTPSGGGGTEKRSTTLSTTASSKLLSARQRLREQRELEERRRFGLAPLAVDVEASAASNTTVEISPNVPQSLAQAPWFYQVEGPTLSHQRLDPSSASSTSTTTTLHDEVDKVVVLGKANTFTAGACHNCGSRTHRTAECFRAKKKVGAKFSGKVTGLDIQLVEKSKKVSYGQKRDRFIGEVGVNLLAAVADANGGEGMMMDGTGKEEEGTVGREKLKMEGRGEIGKSTGDADESRKNHGAGPSPPPGNTWSKKQTEKEKNNSSSSPLNLFSSLSAPSHGGLEIKSLPKYLENLDAMERGDVFFDPRTGSMRGNPNAVPSLGNDGLGSSSSITSAEVGGSGLFQGDLSRYQAGDYHLYVEHQHRFLTGATKSFVDFELDRAVGVLKRKQAEEVKKLRRKHFSDEDEDDEEDEEQSKMEEHESRVGNSGGQKEEEKVSLEALESAAIALGLPVSQYVALNQSSSTHRNNNHDSHHSVDGGGVGHEISGRGNEETLDGNTRTTGSLSHPVSEVVEELFGTKKVTSTQP